MMCKVDQKFPEFALEAYFPGKDDKATVTPETFNGKFLVMFFYPADFTFVCPTELADMQRRGGEFKKNGAEILVVSTDTVYTHKRWIETEELLKGFSFPMGADHSGKLSRELGIYNDESGLASRAAFIIDPDGILRAVDITSDAVGRSAGEILRKVKALQFVRTHKDKVCPSSWDEGAPVIAKSIKISGDAGKGFEN